MIPGQKDPEVPEPEGGDEPDLGEPGAGEEEPNPNPVEGDEGSGGGYGRPQEVGDEDEGKHV